MHQVRLVGSDDRAIHRELLTERLPGTDIDARLRWIYTGNPQGPAHTWIAYDDATGDAAGMTTFFGRKLWINGEVVQSSLGGDMYVRPRFRRRGIGTSLFKAAGQDMERLGVNVMFGTPLRPNVTALVQSGSAVYEESVVRCARILSTSATKLQWIPRPIGALVDPLLAMRAPRGTRLEPLTTVDPRVDKLWEETRGELEVSTVRDAAFYHWRFALSPSQKQKAYLIFDGQSVIAACALEVIEHTLRIVDLLAPRERWKAALHAIAAAVHEESAVEIRLSAGDAAQRHLWTAGLIVREHLPMSVITLAAAGTRLYNTVHDPARWFITWADTDIDHV